MSERTTPLFSRLIYLYSAITSYVLFNFDGSVLPIISKITINKIILIFKSKYNSLVKLSIFIKVEKYILSILIILGFSYLISQFVQKINNDFFNKQVVKRLKNVMQTAKIGF